jgi:phosphate transport system protein
VDALVNMDSGLARRICAADDEVDSIHRDMYRRVEDAIRRNPEAVDELIRHLSVSRNFERIADHATNIAEDVIYMVEGTIIRHEQYSKNTQDAAGQEKLSE